MHEHDKERNMDKVTFKEVGYNIQQLLKERNMTQQMLADSLGVSKQVMSKIISGSKSINVEEISSIASVLATSTDRLLQTAPKCMEVQAFSFMGKISCEKTKAKVQTLNTVIREILLLEEITKAEQRKP